MKHALTMKNGIPVFELKGKIMGGPEANAFHEELKKTVAGGQRKIIIDLGEVEWMNSSGLGMLISALTTVKNAGGDLKLARATEKITSLLVITKLSSVFDSQPTLEATIAAFK
ncbi:STAS domain-containing protein [bacterium]|nr:STAS domain-containing protein [bacterium]MBU1983608.1 STAS domain-containing protein [bacterium]